MCSICTSVAERVATSGGTGCIYLATNATLSHLNRATIDDCRRHPVPRGNALLYLKQKVATHSSSYGADEQCVPHNKFVCRWGVGRWHNHKTKQFTDWREWLDHIIKSTLFQSFRCIDEHFFFFYFDPMIWMDAGDFHIQNDLNVDGIFRFLADTN